MSRKLLLSLNIGSLLFFTGCFNLLTPEPQVTPDDVTPQGDNKLGYYETVAPILAKNCVSCHSEPGKSVAPFPLLTYSDVVKHADSIKSSMQARRMPPPGVENSESCAEIADSGWVADKDIKAVADWVDNGKPMGDPAKAPPSPAPLPEISSPDLTARMPEPFTPRAKPGEIDVYRCFIVDPGLVTSKFMTAFQVLPGEKRVVHHVILYKPTKSGQTELDNLTSTDGLPGYECYGGAGVSAEPLALWAPGVGAYFFPEGTGIPIEANYKLILQMHYNTALGEFPDQTSVALKMASSAKPGKFVMLGDLALSIPPGSANHSESAVVSSALLKLTSDLNPRGTYTAYSVGPHMHNAGTSTRLEKIAGDSSISCLMNLPKWDFNWQRAYNFSTPITIDLKTEKFKITCNYNTMGRTTETKFGENTDDEMCLNFVYMVEN